MLAKENELMAVLSEEETTRTIIAAGILTALRDLGLTLDEIKAVYLFAN